MGVGTHITPQVFREVCGQWATGVAVVTGTDTAGAMLGVAVNSFTSLSLDPPLVLFQPALTSSTWPRIRKVGDFAVNILSAGQAELARSFARSGAEKFAGVRLRTTADGLPALEGAAARIVCAVESTYPGGDREIVVGRVLHAEHEADVDPLLFHRGRTIGTMTHDRSGPTTLRPSSWASAR